MQEKLEKYGVIIQFLFPIEHISSELDIFSWEENQVFSLQSIHTSTEGGSVKALFQILYGQYHIWELYVLDLRTQVFCRKKNQIHFPMDKGLTVPK